MGYEPQCSLFADDSDHNTVCNAATALLLDLISAFDHINSYLDDLHAILYPQNGNAKLQRPTCNYTQEACSRPKFKHIFFMTVYSCVSIIIGTVQIEQEHRTSCWTSMENIHEIHKPTSINDKYCTSHEAELIHPMPWLQEQWLSLHVPTHTTGLHERRLPVPTFLAFLLLNDVRRGLRGLAKAGEQGGVDGDPGRTRGDWPCHKAIQGLAATCMDTMQHTHSTVKIVHAFKITVTWNTFYVYARESLNISCKTPIGCDRQSKSMH